MTHTHRITLLTLLAFLLLSLTTPTSSQASGTYIHRSCLTNSDISDGALGWQPFAYGIPGASTEVRCPSDGLHAEVSVSGQLPPGEGAGWTYYAPSGTRISRTDLTMAGWTKGWSTNQGLVQLLDADGVLSGLTGTIDSQQEDAFDWDGLNTQKVIVRAICDDSGAPCTNAVAWLSIYKSDIYLMDEVAPTVDSVGGPITTDESFSGQERLDFTVKDAGGGIAQVKLYVDGRLKSVGEAVDEGGRRCVLSDTQAGVWVFAQPRPCPRSVRTQQLVDTTKFPDGRHSFAVVVVDAAQQEKTVWSAEGDVVNRPPVNQRLPSFVDTSTYAEPTVGGAIEASSDGLWNVPGTGLVRNWARCDAQGTEASCVSIPGATGLRYTPSIDDVGRRLRLFITARNPAGTTRVSTTPTGVVAARSGSGGSTPDPSSDPDPDPGPSGDPDPDPSGDPGPGTVPDLVIGGNGGVPAPLPPVFGGNGVTPPVGMVPVGNAHALVGHVVGEASGVGCPQEKATLRLERVGGGGVKLGYGRSGVVSAQLLCTNNGKAIEGAKLEVLTRVGARAAVASAVVTDGAGRAVLRLAAGPGRTVTLGYRMYADDAVARATVSLKVSVNGRIRLRGDHRKLRNGKALRLRGQLLGGYVPRRGVALNVQWRDRGRWRPFAQIKTNKKGAFSYAYRFTRTTRPVTYTLRVQASKGQLDYPFRPVASNPVKVTVMP
jgi:hypothetical protein